MRFFGKVSRFRVLKSGRRNSEKTGTCFPCLFLIMKTRRSPLPFVSSSRKFLAATAMVMAFSFNAMAATLIYQDDFSGSGSTNLNGLAPDTATGLLGGSAGATWLANPIFKADGTSSLATASAGSAYLPFSPVSGYVYTISIDIGVTGYDTDHWAAISLVNGTPSTGQAFHGLSNANSYATIGRRDSGYSGNNLLRWQGPKNGGTNSHVVNRTAGVWTLSIILDTQNATDWKFQWLMQGGAGVEVLSPTYDLGTESINYLMISHSNISSFTYDNFSVTAVPEVASSVLAAAGACLFSFRRTRRHS